MSKKVNKRKRFRVTRRVIWEFSCTLEAPSRTAAWAWVKNVFRDWASPGRWEGHGGEIKMIHYENYPDFYEVPAELPDIRIIPVNKDGKTDHKEVLKIATEKIKKDKEAKDAHLRDKSERRPDRPSVPPSKVRAPRRDS